MSTLKNTLTHALIRLLKPVVRILLRHGVSLSEFTELAKLVYVDIAENEFTIEGRKQSVSRICLLTGMHRKEVNRLRERLNEDSLELEQLGRAARIISGWRQDKDFRNKQDNPAPLPLEGEASFTTLIKRYSGDMQVRAVLDELILSGSVRETPDRKIELIRDTYIPTQSDEALLRIMGISSADLLSTINHNLTLSPEQNSRLQMVVDYQDIPLSQIQAFREHSQKEALTLIKNFDQWLDQHTTKPEPGEATQRLGFGLYYFENDIESVQGENNNE